MRYGVCRSFDPMRRCGLEQGEVPTWGTRSRWGNGSVSLRTCQFRPNTGPERHFVQLTLRRTQAVALCRSRRCRWWGLMLVCTVKWLVCGAVTALICRSAVQAVSRWYLGLLRASPAGGIAPRPLGYIELTGRRNAGAIYASLRVRAASLRTRTKLGEPKGSPSAFPYRNLRLTRGLPPINVSNTVLRRCQPTVFQCRESLSIEGSRLLEGPVFGVR